MNNVYKENVCKEEKVIENGKEYIVAIYFNGNKIWYNNKYQYHRLGGLPAVELNDGSKVYWENDTLHRVNGPAVDCIKYKEYWIFNKEYTEKEYYEIINNTDKLNNLINMEIIKEII